MNTKFVIFLALPFLACSNEDDEKSKNKIVVVKARAIPTDQSALKQAAWNLVAGPGSPSYADGEYDGMGVNTSDAVVDGFKIHLTSISFGSNTIQAGSFPIEEGVLDISQGVNDSITVTGSLPGGKWDRVSVGFKPWYALKAYAYMDADNDGTIDKTVFTTANEIKIEDGRLTKEQMVANAYGEYEYGFAYTHCSDSVTNSTQGECGTISIFPEPFDVNDPIVNEDETTEGEEVQQNHVVNILIESTKIVKAWLGTTGEFMVKGDIPTSEFLGDPSKIPMPIGFPASDFCSDTKNEWELNSCDFFPLGTPAFKLQYLPAFAFLSTSGLESQVYAVSTESGIWNHYNSGTIQVVFKNGVPQLGLISSAINGEYDSSASPSKLLRSAAPVLGSVARLFEETGDSSYKFYMDGGSIDANGNDDGGLYYNNDVSMAGYIVEGFTPTAINALSTIVVKDGPRCKSDYDNCIGDRTYYMKRIK